MRTSPCRGASRSFNAGTSVELTALEQRANDPGVDQILRQSYLDETPRSAINDAPRYGTIDGATGYLKLRRLNNLLPGADSTTTRAFVDAELDTVFVYFDGRGVTRIVIDLRRKLGGNGSYGLAFASRFAQGRERIAFSELRPIPTGLSDAEVKRIEPTSHSGFDGPIDVLISPLTASAAVSTVQALRALPHARLIGERTRGILSRTERVLPNGWIVSLTPGHIESPGGDRFEAVGHTAKHRVDVIHAGRPCGRPGQHARCSTRRCGGAAIVHVGQERTDPASGRGASRPPLHHQGKRT